MLFSPFPAVVPPEGRVLAGREAHPVLRALLRQGLRVRAVRPPPAHLPLPPRAHQPVQEVLQRLPQRVRRGEALAEVLYNAENSS